MNTVPIVSEQIMSLRLPCRKRKWYELCRIYESSESDGDIDAMCGNGDFDSARPHS